MFRFPSIFWGSSLAFPKTPLTLDDFISSLLKSSLTKLAQRFFLEQLFFLISNTFIMLKYSVAVAVSTVGGGQDQI